MMKATMVVMGSALGLVLLGAAEAQPPAGAQPAPQERIAALKQSLQEDQARLEFRDYLEAGDVVGVEVDLTSNRLLGLKVSSFLGSPQDPVGLDVRFATLNDGTGYPGLVQLDASAKQIHVAVQNTGYRKVAP